MDNAMCHVVYVNRDVLHDRVLRAHSNPPETVNGVAPTLTGHIGDNLQLLLGFNDVHICATGASCIAKIFRLHDSSMVDLKPTIVLIDTPYDERIPDERPRSRSASPHSRPPPGDVDIHTPDEEVYGLKLLQRIITEAHLRSLSKLVVPIPVISYPTLDAPAANDGPLDVGRRQLTSSDSQSVNRRLIRRCLDLGAADVITSPINEKSITSLEVHAYRAHKDAAREQQAMLEVRRGRKRSWVGINEEKPYAYLREAMVSGLMKGICRLGVENDDMIGNAKIAVSLERQAAIARAVGQWHFCAHDFTDDELLVAAMIMFKHALSMQELERWRIPTEQLINFLVACRAAYNSFVPYHNFQHVVDVLQATFNFLINIGALAPYPPSDATRVDPSPKSPMASLLEPFEALTLLITAIGHDVGHPGVNNGFLVKLNAPLAQLYNDRSVLESFHCAAYSQILRRYWTAAFEDTKMRNLMISSILATDMGLHFDYMKRLGDVQAKLRADNNSRDGWNERMVEEQKALACSLLIKCADVSNVARGYSTAVKWMHLLSDEFSRQASMEGELKIPSSLLSAPNKDATSLATAQLGFMNLFAIPLFQGVADIIPSMRYTVDELDINKELFERCVRDDQGGPHKKRLLNDGISSARTRSIALTTDDGDDCGSAPPPPIGGKKAAPEEFSIAPRSPTKEPSHVPSLPADYKEINGAVPGFDPADPFHMRDRLDSSADSRQLQSGKQRCSETTDGSNSGPYSGDWASQVTSATTGKMPFTPSTQGTSIVSKESMERPPSVPGPASVICESNATSELTIDSARDDESTSNGSIGKAEGKGLKKRPSRFRMNAFPFFRRHKGSSPPIPATDAAT